MTPRADGKKGEMKTRERTGKNKKWETARERDWRERKE